MKPIMNNMTINENYQNQVLSQGFNCNYYKNNLYIINNVNINNNYNNELKKIPFSQTNNQPNN